MISSNNLYVRFDCENYNGLILSDLLYIFYFLVSSLKERKMLNRSRMDSIYDFIIDKNNIIEYREITNYFENLIKKLNLKDNVYSKLVEDFKKEIIKPEDDYEDFDDSYYEESSDDCTQEDKLIPIEITGENFEQLREILDSSEDAEEISEFFIKYDVVTFLNNKLWNIIIDKFKQKLDNNCILKNIHIDMDIQYLTQIYNDCPNNINENDILKYKDDISLWISFNGLDSWIYDSKDETTKKICICVEI